MGSFHDVALSAVSTSLIFAILRDSCCRAVSGWPVFVTFVYFVETAKDAAELVRNANRKPYPSFRMVPFLSRVSILTRDIDIANLSVCPSVCLSVTFRYQMKTA